MAAALPAGLNLRRQSRWGQLGPATLFLLPAMIGFGFFFIRPAILGFRYSFTDKELLRKGAPKGIGFDNYTKLFDDNVFKNALWVTLKYVIWNIGLQTALALGIAVLMERLSHSRVLRTVVLAPWLMSNVVVAMLFLWILDYQLGIFNSFLAWLGIDRIGFLFSRGWVIPSIALINVWRHMGYTALLLFAGLQTIPKEVNEAALIDGVTERQRFFRITMPLLRPVLAVVLVITVIGSFQIFDTVDIATAGGPVHASRVIYIYIAQQAFDRRHFGYASAMSVVIFVILAIISVLQMKLLRANESDLA